MQTSTSPDQTTPVTLRINTNNAAAEVFLLDPQLQLAARGVGSLVTQQIPGVYKVCVRLGRESKDKLILLTGDTTESIDAPVFASPAPLGSTTLTHEYHVAAAEQHSKQPTLTLGNGASIFVFVRYFTPRGQQPRRHENPARDLSLRDLFGTLLADLATVSVLGSEPDGWAACHVRLAPGAYVLQCETPQGPIAQSVIASAGWQTQIFLIRSPRLDEDATEGRVTAPSGIFDMTTVLMSHGAFSSTSYDSHLTDLARIALADERPILGGNVRDLLVQKFENPMQGILGAHLMLLARDRAAASPRQSAITRRLPVPKAEHAFNQNMFDYVVANLRNLVGSDHPDVEALSLQCSQPQARAKQVFSVPPMLRRSWSLVVEASNDHPDILDAILWNRVMTKTPGAPFLSWLVVSDETRAAFEESMREAVESRQQLRSPRKTAAAVDERSPAAGVDAPAEMAMRSAAAATGPASDAFRRGVSRDLEVPRRAVDRMLGGQ